MEDYNNTSCGYNSGDEYGFCESQDLTEAEWQEVSDWKIMVWVYFPKVYFVQDLE